jgi:arsenate reductase
MADRIFNVLFLSTGNSARSIMAEAMLNKLGAGRFRAFSAGSDPKGAVHPLALRELVRLGLATGGLASKHWNVFAAPDAPEMDFICTFYDSAAGETCPWWPGRFAANWSLEDPAAVEPVRPGFSFGPSESGARADHACCGVSDRSPPVE